MENKECTLVEQIVNLYKTKSPLKITRRKNNIKKKNKRNIFVMSALDLKVLVQYWLFFFLLSINICFMISQLIRIGNIDASGLVCRSCWRGAVSISGMWLQNNMGTSPKFISIHKGSSVNQDVTVEVEKEFVTLLILINFIRNFVRKEPHWSS